MKRRYLLVSVASAGILAVAACGGGGGNPSPAPAPTVASVDPNPVVGSDADQTITFKGTGFINKPTVVLNSSEVTSFVVPVEKVTYVSETELAVSVATTTVADTWSVKVTNPDQQSSNILSFNVVSPRNYANGYPYDSATVGDPDSWGFDVRSAMSYVAWRMNQAAARTVAPYFFFNTMGGGTWGEADHWDDNITVLQSGSSFYRVDDVASPGSIAQWNVSDLGAGATVGHVAYVEKVNADGSVDVSEYNRKGDHRFGVRLNVRPARFIHIPLIASDGDFADWSYFGLATGNTAGVPSSGLSSGSASYSATGGHPGAEISTFNYLVNADLVWTGGVRNDFVYEPAKLGGIRSVAMSADFIMPYTNGATGLRMVAEQNGVRYFGNQIGVFYSGQGWSTVAMTEMVAADFYSDPNLAVDSAHPDFGSTANQIRFGVVTFNGIAGWAGVLSGGHGIDNYTVTINR